MHAGVAGTTPRCECGTPYDLSSTERKASRTYNSQPEAQAAGMAKDERSHAHIFRSLQTEMRGGITGSVQAQFEGRHRNTGGNALRAAVLGDG